MKKHTYLFGLAAFAFLAVTCQEKPTDIPAESEIVIGAASPSIPGIEAKGLLDSEVFEQTAGSVMKVYDIYKASGYDETTYIDDNIVCTGISNTVWNYQSRENYYWTKTGKHQFYGWLTADGHDATNLSASKLFGTGFSFNATSRTLTIPSATMTQTAPQFDFLYSNIIVRDRDNSGDVSSVKLQMSHLFSAFGIAAKNGTDSDIIIKSVQVCGLKDKNNASIKFNLDTNPSVNVTYGTATHVPGDKFTTSGGNITLQRRNGSNCNNIFGTTAAERSQTSYFLMWPQKASDFTVPSGAYSYSETEGYVVNNYDAPLLIVKYAVGGEDFTGVAEFPKADASTYRSWEAGKKYLLTILFSGKQMSLEVKVNPWDYVEQTIDYDKGTVSLVEGHDLSVLQESGNCVINGKNVTFTTGVPVRSKFLLGTPVGATWQVSLAGESPEAFDLMDNANNVTGTVSGTIDSTTEAIFKIKPKTGLPAGTYKTRVSITVKLPDGRAVPADIVAQGADESNYYTFIHNVI